MGGNRFVDFVLRRLNAYKGLHRTKQHKYSFALMTQLFMIIWTQIVKMFNYFKNCETFYCKVVTIRNCNFFYENLKVV